MHISETDEKKLKAAVQWNSFYYPHIFETLGGLSYVGSMVLTLCFVVKICYLKNIP